MRKRLPDLLQLIPGGQNADFQALKHVHLPHPDRGQKGQITYFETVPSAEKLRALRHVFSCIARIGAAFQRAVKGKFFAITAHIFLQDNSVDASGQWRPSQHPQGLAIGQLAVKRVPCSGAALGQRHVQRASLLAQSTIKAKPIHRRIRLWWMGIWSADLLRQKRPKRLIDG